MQHWLIQLTSHFHMRALPWSFYNKKQGETGASAKTRYSSLVIKVFWKKWVAVFLLKEKNKTRLKTIRLVKIFWSFLAEQWEEYSAQPAFVLVKQNLKEQDGKDNILLFFLCLIKKRRRCQEFSNTLCSFLLPLWSFLSLFSGKADSSAHRRKHPFPPSGIN